MNDDNPPAGSFIEGLDGRRWVPVSPDGEARERAFALAREVGISPIVALLLINRGVTDPDEARRFLQPSLDDLHDPFLLPDMEFAVRRLRKALETGEKILIHGDYDADGVTSAALLIRVLRALGANVEHFVPHRRRDGYGIKPHAVERAHSRGISLIVTADCGVTACDTAEQALQLGVDLIVTDHHEPGPNLPDALAVINPVRHDSDYPFPDLAGVGVAFKLAQALVRDLGHDERSFQTKFLDLVALGTVADVSPILGENRVLVKYGLEAMAESKKVGLQALIRSSGLIRGGEPLTTYMLGYIIGPRINAVGRMDDAAIALRLLLTKDEHEAEELSALLEQRNQERQEEQARILNEAFEMLAERDLESSRVLVLAAPGWNSGVVGVVAGKLVDRYCRPAVVLCADVESGIAAGSARSIEGFSIVEALARCEDVLQRYGGHAGAVGLSLPLRHLPELEARLNEAAAELPEEAFIPRWDLDGILEPSAINLRLAEEISLLEPFGQGNPEPLFASEGMTVLQKRRVGSGGAHLKLFVRSDGVEPTDCIGFGLGDLDSEIAEGRDLDLCYSIRVNEFNGRRTAQMLIRDLRVSDQRKPTTAAADVWRDD